MVIFSGSYNPSDNFYVVSSQYFGVDLSSNNSIQHGYYFATMPPFDQASGQLSCPEATVLSINVTALDHFNLKVEFSSPVINNFALINPLNYVFTPSLTVNTVTPDNITGSVSYVTLGVIGMTNQSYSLTIQTVEASGSS